jgi:DNA polymerase
VTLYPLYHPAAALYTPTMLEVLERDVARLPELLEAGEARPADPIRARPAGSELEPAASPIEGRDRQPVQLGLF